MAIPSPQIAYRDTSKSQALMQLAALLGQSIQGIGDAFQQNRRTALMEEELEAKKGALAAEAEQGQMELALRELAARGKGKDPAATRQAMRQTGAPLSKILQAFKVAEVEPPSPAEQRAQQAALQKRSKDQVLGHLHGLVGDPDTTVEQAREDLRVISAGRPGFIPADELRKVEDEIDEREAIETVPRLAGLREAVAAGLMSWDEATVIASQDLAHPNEVVAKYAHGLVKEGMTQRMNAAEAAGNMAEVASTAKGVFIIGMSEDYDLESKVRTFKSLLTGGLRRTFSKPVSEAEKDWVKEWGGEAKPVTAETFDIYLEAKVEKMRAAGKSKADAIHATNLQLMAMSGSSLPSLEGKMKDIKSLFATASFDIQGVLPPTSMTKGMWAYAEEIVNRVY